MSIPFLFYNYSKRYIYSVQIENRNEENEKMIIESLSPTMWGTKRTEFTSSDIRYRSKSLVSNKPCYCSKFQRPYDIEYYKDFQKLINWQCHSM